MGKYGAEKLRMFVSVFLKKGCTCIAANYKNRQSKRTKIWHLATCLNINLKISIPFSKLRTKLSSKILISLCTSLLLLLIVFLVGIERTSNQRRCQLTAVLLHYFILATFMWMGVEAFNIYKIFVKVFQKRSRKIFLIRASIIAWGE